MLPENEPYLIGETASHHEGNVDFLKDLIKEGANNGADAIKCHLLFDVYDYMIKNHEAVKKLGEICISREKWDYILDYIISLDVDPIFLCNDVASFDWVIQNSDRIQVAEIHATGINDIFLLKKAAEFNGTIILGIGGSTLEELHFAVNFLNERDQEDIFLMHGFQNYPTNYEDVKLSRISRIKELFNLPVGYADHTDPKDENNSLISVLPAVLGVNVLEKHFTTVPDEERIDSQSAVDLDTLREIKEKFEIVWKAKGEKPFSLTDAERKYGDTGPMKKAIVANERISEGKSLTLGKLAYKRTNNSTYIKQRDIFKIQGATAKCNIKEDEIIDYSKINYRFRKGNFDSFKIEDK